MLEGIWNAPGSDIMNKPCLISRVLPLVGFFFCLETFIFLKILKSQVVNTYGTSYNLQHVNSKQKKKIHGFVNISENKSKRVTTSLKK